MWVLNSKPLNLESNTLTTRPRLPPYRCTLPRYENLPAAGISPSVGRLLVALAETPNRAFDEPTRWSLDVWSSTLWTGQCRLSGACVNNLSPVHIFTRRTRLHFMLLNTLSFRKKGFLVSEHIIDTAPDVVIGRTYCYDQQHGSTRLFIYRKLKSTVLLCQDLCKTEHNTFVNNTHFCLMSNMAKPRQAHKPRLVTSLVNLKVIANTTYSPSSVALRVIPCAAPVFDAEFLQEHFKFV